MKERAIRAKSVMAKTALILVASAKSFQRNRGLMRAASLALYCFLALPPLLLLITILLSRLFTFVDGLETGFRRFLETSLPLVSEAILQEVETLAHQRAWGWMGVIVLFWSVTPLAAAIRHSMTDIFRATPRRAFFINKGADALAVVLLLITMLALTVIESVKTLMLQVRIGSVPILRVLTQYAAPLAIATVLLAVVFAITAPVRLRKRELWSGAFLTALLLLSVGPAMTAILRLNPEYGYTFGSLKTLFLLIVWVYYSFAAVLIGAEVIANVRRADALALARLFRRGGAGRLETEALRRLTREIAPAEPLFELGDAGAEMFYVLEGTVDMRLGGQTIKTFVPGEYFGEMALLLGAPRTASARAGEAGARLAAVSAENLDDVLRENPDVILTLLRELAQRLKTTNERLVPPPHDACGVLAPSRRA